jgi:hypothetical protein
MKWAAANTPKIGITVPAVSSDPASDTQPAIKERAIPSVALGRQPIPASVTDLIEKRFLRCMVILLIALAN